MKRLLLITLILLFSATAWASPATDLLEKLMASLEPTDFHPNDRWPNGIKGEKTTCKEDRYHVIPCKGFVSHARAGTVRNEKHRGQWVAQEVHVFQYASRQATDAALCKMKKVNYGPFNKHPYKMWRYGESSIVAVEGRFRFPRFLEELTADIQKVATPDPKQPDCT